MSCVCDLQRVLHTCPGTAENPCTLFISWHLVQKRGFPNVPWTLQGMERQSEFRSAKSAKWCKTSFNFTSPKVRATQWASQGNEKWFAFESGQIVFQIYRIWCRDGLGRQILWMWVIPSLVTCILNSFKTWNCFDPEAAICQVLTTAHSWKRTAFHKGAEWMHQVLPKQQSQHDQLIPANTSKFEAFCLLTGIFVEPTLLRSIWSYVHFRQPFASWFIHGAFACLRDPAFHFCELIPRSTSLKKKKVN